MVQKKWVLVSYNDEDFKKQNDDLTKSYVHFCHSIPIVLQDGPTCGIAALTSVLMALDPRRDPVTTANNVLQRAIGLGVSCKGEVLSIEYMSQICRSISLPHSTVELGLKKQNEVVSLLHDSVLMLIYDKDKNNEPTVKYNGERAHWLLLTGFCFLPKNPMSQIHYPYGANNFFKAKKSAEEGNLFVFSQHGRSKVRRLWSWDSVLESNRNIHKVKPGDWIIPDDIHRHTAEKAIRIPILSNSQ